MKHIDAKKIVARLLAERGIEYDRLRAKTVRFADLARNSAIFVKPIGIQLPDPRLRAVKEELPKGLLLELPDVVG